MFNVNLSHQVVSSLTVKKTKITEYGKNGEISPSKIKTRIYNLLPGKQRKYINITSIDIEWIPTIPHLLTEVKMMLELVDGRIISNRRDLGSLLIINKSANNSWNYSTQSNLYYPLESVLTGLPIHASIDINVFNIKGGVEIGKMKFKFNFIFRESACPIASVSARLSVDRNIEYVKNYLTGDPKDPSQDEDFISLIQKYLNGDITIFELKQKLNL